MKVFILYHITTNEEWNNKSKVLVGVYDSYQKAESKGDEMHATYRERQLTHPELDCISESIQIDELFINNENIISE